MSKTRRKYPKEYLQRLEEDLGVRYARTTEGRNNPNPAKQHAKRFEKRTDRQRIKKELKQYV